MFGPEDEEYGAFEEPLFKDELEFEAEIEREVAANAREAEVAVMEPPSYSDEHVPRVLQPADGDGIMTTEVPAGEDGERVGIMEPDPPAEPAGPLREAVGSFMVPIEIDGLPTSRELRRLARCAMSSRSTRASAAVGHGVDVLRQPLHTRELRHIF